MKLSSMKLGTQLGIGFGVVLFLSVVIGISGYWGANSISGTTQKMLRTDAKISEHSSRARAGVVGLRRYEKDIFLNIGNKEKQEGYLKQWKEQNEHLSARISDLEKAASLPQDKELIKTMKSELAVYSAGFDKVVAMIQAGTIKTPQEGNAAIAEVKEATHKL
jgi:methyl-accepting chemotaxis protein